MSEASQKKLKFYYSRMPPSIGILRRYFENIKQIHRRTPTRQSEILIKLGSSFTEIALQHGYSPVNLLHILRALFNEKIRGYEIAFQKILHTY